MERSWGFAILALAWEGNSFFGLGRNYCHWIDMLSEGKVYYYALVRRDHHVPSIYC